MTLPTDILQYLEEHAAPLVRQVDDSAVQFFPVNGGRNNRVFRAESGGQRFLIKWFFSGQDKRWDRWRSETVFADWAERCGAASPSLLAAEQESQLAVFRWVDGRRPAPEDIDESAVRQACSFLETLNREKSKATNVGAAAEACFRIDDHVANVESRLNRLLALPGDTRLDDAARELAQRLQSEMSSWRSRCGIEDAHSNRSDELPLAERILSPSDFGFHNALLEPAGRFVFCDFEYAGWDDPAKTICDAVCQVQTPIPLHRQAALVDAVCGVTTIPIRTWRRAKLLLPLYRIKWCCILLNEFHRSEQQRRSFAFQQTDLHSQLEQAKRLAAEIHQPLQSKGYDD